MKKIIGILILALTLAVSAAMAGCAAQEQPVVTEDTTLADLLRVTGKEQRDCGDLMLVLYFDGHDPIEMTSAAYRYLVYEELDLRDQSQTDAFVASWVDMRRKSDEAFREHTGGVSFWNETPPGDYTYELKYSKEVKKALRLLEKRDAAA